jgi:integrase
VYQRKSSDGRWVATLPFTRADGTPDRFTEYHRSKPEAEEAYRRMIAKRDAGLQLGTDRQTVEEFMEAWLSTSVKPNVREITYREYKSVVKTHIVPELGKRTLGSLTRQGLQLWVNGLSEKGLAPSTVGKVHIRLHAALEEAVHWDILSRNPADGLRLPRMRKTEAVVLDADQARALLKEIHGHRWEALFAVALAIGLRRGEICGMMWSDIDLDKRVLHVRHTLQIIEGKLTITDPKTQASTATIPIPVPLVRILRAHRVRQLEEKMHAGSDWVDTGLVFTMPLGTGIWPTTLWKQHRALLERAGLPFMKLHDLRKSCATLMHAQGVSDKEIQAILRHASPLITGRLYIQGVPSLQRQAVDDLGALLFGSE